MSAMTSYPWAKLLLVLGVFLIAPHQAAASDAPTTEPNLTKKGADSCIKCHDEDDEFPVMEIFKTKHARPTDQRTPFGGLQCEACHGPGSDHAKKTKKGVKPLPIENFDPGSTDRVDQQNDRCLNCHQDQERIRWQGSTHQGQGLSCSSCHVSHAAADPALEPESEVQVCLGCHTQQRASLHQFSRHPLEYGKMACSECHDPHGGFGPFMLSKPTTNEMCYLCHAEMRGPFLWPHAPAVEDCLLCHRAHGSNHPALLSKRSFLLCRQCHAPGGHPSVAPTGRDLPSQSNRIFDRFLLVNSCMNCHSRIHGSNHPSGVKLLR